jgi:mono/diheme cytochrome c family protein
VTARRFRILTCGLVLAACIVPAAAQTYRVRERDADWVAPAAEAARPNPLTSQPQLAAGGRKLFAQRCSECHGDDRRGTDRAPDLTAPAVQTQTDGALFWKISSGDAFGGMPSFSFLPRQQRWQLVMFLRQPGTRDSEPVSPATAGPSASQCR